MSNKRFTDTKKWRTSWFRKLTSEQKLVWMYLCDECEFYGVIKLDYAQASFQLNFVITPTVLRQWFPEKLYFFDDEKIVIIPFFEFQYAESKDTWTAKIRARQKLEALGFLIENNKLVIPKTNIPKNPEVQSPDSGGTGLIEGISIIKSIIKIKSKVNAQNKEIEFFDILNASETTQIYTSCQKEIEEIERFLKNEHCFGEKLPVLIKRSFPKFCATLLAIYDFEVEDFRQHMEAIINEPLSEEKNGLERKEYIQRRIQNKAMELFRATH